MLDVDEFESAFRSAIKERYQHSDLSFASVLFICDLPETEASPLLGDVKGFCGNIKQAESAQWQLLSAGDYQTADDLLTLIQQKPSDLIVTYRNLHSDSWRHPFSLGEHIDVLLQQTDTPVLLIPHPQAGYARSEALKHCASVMVVTDHLVNDHRLVQHGLAFLNDTGHAYLSHIEDQYHFDRFMAAIGRIPGIETEGARSKLHQQLLKEPTEYIQSVKAALEQISCPKGITPIVEFGHQLKDHLVHIEEKQVDLLVMNTKDGEQLAMHGLAYPLAIEARQIPLLML